MNKKIILSLVAVGVVSSLSAAEFTSVGYKSNGMGGTGVSNSYGSSALYMNPAMLGFSKPSFDLETSVSIGYEDHKLLPAVNSLENNNFSEILDKAALDPTTLTVADKANMVESLSIISKMDGDSLSIKPSASLGIQIGGFALGALGYGEIAGKSVVDTSRTSFSVASGGNYYDIDGNTITQTEYENTSIEYAINNGLTRIDLEGMVIGEVPLGYGQAFSTPYGQLAVGGAVKYMYGQSSFVEIALDNSDSFADDYDKNSKTSSTFGIDAGLAFKPSLVENLTVGLVGKNLNSPTFDKAVGEYKIEPMVRAGVSYDLWNSLEFAVDYDITKNKGLLNDFDTQYLAAGVNYHQFSFFDLSAGIKKNLAENSSPNVYTAGIGFGPQFLRTELSGQMTTASHKIGGEEIPAAAQITLSLVSSF